MFVRKSKVEKLNKGIDKINYVLERNQVMDLLEILGNKKQILIRNLLSGISKGIGIGIGVTIITAIIVLILQKIVTLNIPILGDYIADIVEIVKNKL